MAQTLLPSEQFLWRGFPALLIGIPRYIQCGLVLFVFYQVEQYGTFLLRALQINPASLTAFLPYLKGVFVSPVLVTLWKMASLLVTRYELSSQRLLCRDGLLSRTTEHLELYRVRDYQLQEPFYLRLAGLSNILILSNDQTNPHFIIEGIENGPVVINLIREHVEQQRRDNPIQSLS